jgi:cell fate (sporulation/competence/biofilm development) regulator YlbF (YheA/YmcA/DUF963 family)
MKINYKIVAEHLGVPLRGNETFTELLEIEKQVKEKRKVEPDLKEFKKASDWAERQERIAEENANIQRVDAQTKKYWGK